MFCVIVLVVLCRVLDIKGFRTLVSELTLLDPNPTGPTIGIRAFLLVCIGSRLVSGKND